MPTSQNIQLPPPEDWQEFEDICCDLWKKIWNDANAQKNGRLGQKQDGVDISGRPNNGDVWAGVQCKGKNNYDNKKIKKSEILKEIENAKAFKPKLSELVFAISGKKDKDIEEFVRLKTQEHIEKGLFTISLWAWPDIFKKLAEYNDLLIKHYPFLTAFQSPQLKASIESLHLKIDSLIPSIPSSDYLSLASNDTLKIEFDQIKELIEQGKLDSARFLLSKMDSTIQSENIDNKEVLFIFNAYYAETYIKSFDEVKKAIPYLYKAVEYAIDEQKKYRNLSFAHFIEGDYSNALEIINKALEIEPNGNNELILKSHILLKLGRKDDIRELISDEVIKGNSDLLYTRALIEYIERKYEFALELAEKALLINPDHHEIRHLKINICLSEIGDTININGIILKNQINRVKELIENISAFLTLLEKEKSEDTGLFAYLHSKRGILFNWVGLSDKAKYDHKRAYELSKNDFMINKNYLICLGASQDYQNALEVIDNIENIKEIDEETKLIISEILISAGNAKKAIDILTDSINKQTTENQDFRFHESLIDALDREMEFEQAEEKINKFLIKYGNQEEILMAKAKHLRLKGEIDKAIKLFQDILFSSKGRNRVITIALLAETLSYRGTFQDYKKASELYGEIVNFEVDINLENYAISLYKSGQFVKCIDFCQRVNAIHGYRDILKEIEADIYMQSGNYSFSKYIYLSLYKRNPKILRYQLSYAQAAFKAGDIDDANQALEICESKVTDSVTELTFFSIVYSIVGKHIKALEKALKALDQDPDNESSYLNYFAIFTRAETFVSTIDQKYVWKYQEIIRNFKEKFPDAKWIHAHTFDKDKSFKEIIDYLKSQNQYFKETEKLFMESFFPVSALSQRTGKDIITTWRHITNSYDLKIWEHVGDNKQLDVECSVVRKSNKIILDIVSLLTINALHIFDEFIQYFDEVYVVNEVLDELRNYVQLKELSLREHTVVWYDGDKLNSYKIPLEVVKQEIDEINVLIQLIVKKEKILLTGKSISRLEKGVDEKVTNLKLSLAPYTIETIIEGSYRGIPIYSDDYLLRALGNTEFKTQSFCSLSLLKVLYENEILSDEKYFQSLSKLITLNYCYIPITPAFLQYEVESNSFLMNKESLIPFCALRNKNYSESSISNVAIHFLNWLWSQDLDMIDNIVKWTDVLIKCIIFNRDGSKIKGMMLRNEDYILRSRISPFLYTPKNIQKIFRQTINMC